MLYNLRFTCALVTSCQMVVPDKLVIRYIAVARRPIRVVCVRIATARTIAIAVSDVENRNSNLRDLRSRGGEGTVDTSNEIPRFRNVVLWKIANARPPHATVYFQLCPTRRSFDKRSSRRSSTNFFITEHKNHHNPFIIELHEKRLPGNLCRRPNTRWCRELCS